jgi:hypothetical protein
MKLWETYFRLWQTLTDCSLKGTTKSRLMEKPVKKTEQIKSVPESETYRECGKWCNEDFGMPLG